MDETHRDGPERPTAAPSRRDRALDALADLATLGAAPAFASGLAAGADLPGRGLGALVLTFGAVTGLAVGPRLATGFRERGYRAIAPILAGLGQLLLAALPSAEARLLGAAALAGVAPLAAGAAGPGRGRAPLGLLALVAAPFGFALGVDAARRGVGLVDAGATLVAGGILVGLALVGPATRAFFLVLGPLLYRVVRRGEDRIPREGGALIVCNHVSFVDWWLLGLGARRPIRSVIDRSYHERPAFRWLLDAHRVIPVDAQGSSSALLRSLRDAGQALADGELVCIFAEGQISRLGGLLPFQRGLERMAKGRGAPVIPAHIEGLAGSLFAPRRGISLPGLPGRRRRVRVAFGAPLPPETPAAEIRDAVLELECEAWREENRERPPLHDGALHSARRAPRRIAVVDGDRRLSRIALAAGALLLGRRLAPRLEEREPVAMLLPPGAASSLVALAASLSGRALLPLNPGLGPAALHDILARARARHVVTSTEGLRTLGLELPADCRVLEVADLVAGRGFLARCAAALAVLLLPRPLVERLSGAPRGVRPDDPAALLFTSGSSGAPKGVVLEQAQVAANVAQVARVLPLAADEVVLGSLPLFHAFGLLVNWLAIAPGLRLVAHPSPLDAAGVGRTVAEERVTVLVATPTFLGLYLRRCTPGQFGSLRHVVVGAERLAPEMARAFAAQFGLDPLEGYGMTEASPVVALSSPHFRGRGVFQPGHRESRVGRPLPGVRIAVVDPETGAPRPDGEEGLILVSGPNLMRGYLGDPVRTSEALGPRGYVTGDIGRIDEEGLLEIRDRLARFSKVGGEMVPHGRVEEAMQSALQVAERVFAIVAVPDEKKGERLVLFHLVSDADLERALDGARAAGLPNLFLPRREDCRRLEAFPMLPSGKLDLRALREQARA